jgi:hypothetical protein
MICNLTMNHSSCDVDVLTFLGASATFETLQDQELTFDVKTTSVSRNVLAIDYLCAAGSIWQEVLGLQIAE